MALVLEGHIKVPVDELETIKNNLNEHIQNTLNEDGCLEFTVEQDGIDECIFNVLKSLDIVVHLMRTNKESELVIGVL